MSFEVIIGIEIHCELKTKTKMFSGAPVSFGNLPNTCVNEIDLGHPGTLPSLNKRAVELAITACELMNCNIDRLIRFDRKNYYYSDLPKGFQITQQFHPIGRGGYVDIEVDGVNKRIGINRLHMEEDTAKQFHHGDVTWIDFNRAGTPLVEIVSEPDIRSGKEAAAFVEKMKSLLEFGDISDVKMEEGSLRCDVNISLRPYGFEGYGTKVEIKNLNSVNNVLRAVEAEIARQTEVYLKGESIVQSTRRYDEASRKTVLMRKKEGAVDYKYFPEPNIPPIKISDEFYLNVKQNLPKTAQQRKDDYIDGLGLSDYDASILTSGKDLSDYFDAIVALGAPAKNTANWLISEVLSVAQLRNDKKFADWINPQNMADLLLLVSEGKISGKQAKEVFADMVHGESPKDIVTRKGLIQVSDEGQLLSWVLEVLNNNAQSIEDYKNGKDRALGFLIGQVMKLSKGKANPAMTSELLVQELSKR
jgi:aspartyl-tRNA(Asn)/glutamyl-tRNA(Gln) amidotransferase subunit B